MKNISSTSCKWLPHSQISTYCGYIPVYILSFIRQILSFPAHMYLHGKCHGQFRLYDQMHVDKSGKEQKSWKLFSQEPGIWLWSFNFNIIKTNRMKISNIATACVIWQFLPWAISSASVFLIFDCWHSYVVLKAMTAENIQSVI